MSENTDHIGDYVLKGELGRGAMARVWRAWDPKLNREVAIKEPLFDQTLRPETLDEMGRRFVAEGRAAARLSHPNIVTIYTADVWDGRPAIVMELIQGKTLSQLLDNGPLAPETALYILDQLLDATGYSHEHGVIHRDIKPDNVFVDSDGRVRLTDFGVAHVDNGATRATVAGTVLGTPGYMSPEQVRGDVVDSRSDLFSIGVVAHEMLTGSNPFGTGDGTTLLYRIVYEPPAELPASVSAGLPADLRPAIAAALAKNPADRPQTAADFKAMLHGYKPVPVSTTAVGKMPPVAQHRAPAPKSGVRWLPYVLVGVCGIAILSVVFLFATNGGAKGTVSTASVASSGTTETAAAKKTFAVSFDGGIAHDGKMEAVNTESGESFVVPKCSFTCDGYNFLYWVDESGMTCEPGDTITINADKTLTAQWERASAPAAASTTPVESTPAATPAAPAESTPAASTPAPTAASSPASTFPRRWSGTYTGTSSYVNTPDHHIQRAVALDLTSVEESGYFEGTCYVGAYESGPGETYGTCAISGNVDWSSGSIHFQGTYWIDQGGLGDLREYSGTVNFSSKYMEGSAWDVSTGNYETPWNLSAVDTISIMQNGSLTTIG